MMNHLLSDFQEWARRRGLVPSRHDAQFQGRLHGIRCELETGIRPERLYVVRVVLGIASSLGDCLIRTNKNLEPSERPIVAAIDDVLRRNSNTLSVRLDRTEVTIRLQPGSTPGDVEDVINDVRRALTDGVSPYR